MANTVLLTLACEEKNYHCMEINRVILVLSDLAWLSRAKVPGAIHFYLLKYLCFMDYFFAHVPRDFSDNLFNSLQVGNCEPGINV